MVVDDSGQIVSHNQRLLQVWDIRDNELPGVQEGSAEGIADHYLLSRVLARVANPDAFLGRVKELYANPEAEDHCTPDGSRGRGLRAAGRRRVVLRQEERPESHRMRGMSLGVTPSRGPRPPASRCQDGLVDRRVQGSPHEGADRDLVGAVSVLVHINLERGGGQRGETGAGVVGAGDHEFTR